MTSSSEHLPPAAIGGIDANTVGAAGRRLLRAGFVLGALGALLTLVAIAPLVLGRPGLPLGFYLASLALPGGVALALLGLSAQRRTRSRLLRERYG